MQTIYEALKVKYESEDFESDLLERCDSIISNPEEFNNKNILNKLISTSAVLSLIKRDRENTKDGLQKIRLTKESLKFKKRLLNNIASNLNTKDVFRKDVLFISANPREHYLTEQAENLGEDKEYMHLLELEKKEWASLNACFHCSYDMFRNELQLGGYEIIHFSCHGSDEGIVLRKNEEEVDLVTTQEIGRVLSVFDCLNDLEFVFLNACHSESMAKALKRKFPEVNFAYYNKAVPLGTAVKIAEEYYKALINEFDSHRIETAYKQAYRSMHSRGAIGGIDYFKII